ncbi:MAG TPA: DUF1801 domain-containing protein [Candidatus Bathyarchaeia archaeon]|nr:DUF1801 domain-containing protein [Candidatus Bathyarchaeia archaeon]
MNSPQKSTQKSANSTTATSKNAKAFTDEERGAIRDRVQEMKAGKGEGESAVLAKIAEMREPDRTMAKRLHAIIRETAPALSPRLWYGMPAYAKDDKVVCFFQAAAKFKTRYATFGFSDKANLDEGHMWPNAFALKGLTAAEEARIAALVKKAVS